jgi:hypothetical protein
MCEVFMQPIIEINDPGLDKEFIYQQINTRLSQRSQLIDLEKVGPESLYPREDEADDPLSASFPSLHESIVDLMMTHRLEEAKFQSDAPLVGPLIVAFRRVWNWMSTKWYVIPLIQQQSRLNSKMVVLMMQMIEWQAQKDQQIVALKDRISLLESQVQEPES